MIGAEAARDRGTVDPCHRLPARFGAFELARSKLIEQPIGFHGRKLPFDEFLRDHVQEMRIDRITVGEMGRASDVVHHGQQSGMHHRFRFDDRCAATTQASATRTS